MMITRISAWSGIQHTLDIPVTLAQIQAWRDGTVIQLAMPHLAPWQREFMLTGMTHDEWQQLSHHTAITGEEQVWHNVRDESEE